jgi:arylsulfatase A-like enzyme
MLCIGTGIFMLAGCGSPQPERHRLMDPSVGDPPLIILGLDTFRADHLGCYGNSEVLTPRIDELASESILFENCRSTSTWTLPAFASLWTGLLPAAHGAVGGASRRLRSGVPTLAEVLQDRGYRTRGFVAVDFLTDAFGMTRGFDRTSSVVDGPISGRVERVHPRVFNFLRSPPPGPWLLFVHYFDAHDPYDPPAPFDRMYYRGDPAVAVPGRGLDVLFSERNRVRKNPERRYRWLEGVRDFDFPVRQYAAGISHVDHHVGALLDSLRSNELLDRSILVVVGDHGEHLGEHDVYFTHQLPYEECLQVPLLVRLPGAREGGRRVSDPVSLADVFPTILDLLGIEFGPAVDGRSFMAAMSGENLQPAYQYAEYGGQPSNRVKAVWDDRFKLIEFSQDGRDWIELYDLHEDPGELRDLSSERPELRRRLGSALSERFGPERRIFDGASTSGEDLPPEVEERLRALGYID